ncbi:MAG TPA: hemolysin family protein [Acidimicrobiales bacterium]
MSGAEILAVVAVVVLLGAAIVMALAETSLTHITRAKASSMEEEGVRGASTLRRLLDHPERVLNPVLLLVLLCHLAIATVVAVVVENRFGAGWVAVAALAELLVIYVVGEAAPKTYALQHTPRAAAAVAPVVGAVAGFPPLRWLTRLLIGISNVLLPGRGRSAGPTVTEEELLAFADVAAEAEVIEDEERALIESIIEFGDTVAREVMVPRPDMISVAASFKIADVMEVVILNGYSRLPVYGEGIDDIVGLVYAKDLMRAERDGRGDLEVRELQRPAQFVPETKRVAELLREMQAEKFHMAIVVDEYGGTAGLVTLEDLIEELVGEIVDEFDVEDPLVEPLPGGDVRVNARMSIDELNDLLHSELPEGDWDTVGGLVYSLLGHVPVEGETVEVDGRTLRAERVQGRRIGRVRITKVASPA